MEMLESMRKVQPKEVGGSFRRIMGAREVEDRISNTKFRHERRRFGKEQQLLSLEEAILI